MARTERTETDGTTGAPRRGALTRARGRVAQVVLVVLTLCALLLAIGALLVALRHNINSDNALVRLVVHIDDAIDGPFSRSNGIFAFHGKSAVSKEALVNWGIAAVVYLVVARVLHRLIRP